MPWEAMRILAGFEHRAVADRNRATRPVHALGCNERSGDGVIRHLCRVASFSRSGRAAAESIAALIGRLFYLDGPPI